MSASYISDYENSNMEAHPQPLDGQGPDLPMLRPNTLMELYRLRHAARLVRHNPRTLSCDEELEDVADKWLSYLNSLHDHLVAYPFMQQARHANIAHWRDTIEQLHCIIQRAASNDGLTALDMTHIFPDHMLGRDLLSPLEQSRLAIIKLAEGRFGDWLVGLGNWPQQPLLFEPGFWINKGMVYWSTSLDGNINNNPIGTLDICFLKAIDYLNQHGGDMSFLITSPVLDSSSGSSSDSEEQPAHDEEDLGYWADEEDLDDLDEPLSPEDHRRTVRELLEEMLHDIDAMIDAVPEPEPEPKETAGLQDEDWTDDDQFYPNNASNKYSAVDQVTNDDKYHEGGDDGHHDIGEDRGGEDDQYYYSNDENESSDTDSGTIIHTPQEPEPEESEDGGPSDDDPSDDSGSEGEQQAELPYDLWLPSRQPIPAQHSLYSFQSWGEAFLPPLLPIPAGQQLQPPIQRPVIAAPAPAPTPEPAPVEPELFWDHILDPIRRMVDQPLPMPPTPRLPSGRQVVWPQANIVNEDPFMEIWGSQTWQGDARDLRHRPLYRAMWAGMAQRQRASRRDGASRKDMGKEK